jgi:hypothetical protein
MLERGWPCAVVIAGLFGCSVMMPSWAEDGLLPALRLDTLPDGSTILINREGEVAAIISGEESHGFVHGPPPQVLGWPLFVGEVEATPTVANITADGRLDVVFGTISAEGLLYVVDASGRVRPGWPLTGFRSGHTPSVANVNDDQNLEIFAQGDLKMAGLRGDGVSLIGWPQGTSGFSTAGIADVDADGVVEIAAMGRNGMAHLWRPDGTEKPGWPYLFPTPEFFSSKGPGLGDLDGDGRLEVAIANQFDPSVFAISSDAVLMQGFPIYLSVFGLKQGLSMADMDRDGLADLVFVASGGLWFVHGDGQPFAGFPTPAPRSGNSPPAIGDLDGDGRLEVVWATIGGDAQVFVYRDDGTPYPGWPVTVPSFSFNPQPTLGDVDGDGAVDIVVGGFTASLSPSGRIYAWHADGTLVAGFPFSIPDGKNVLGSSVTITDLDQDGDVDLLVGTVTGLGGTTDGRVFAFDLPAPYDPTTMEWPTLGHDAQHTARYEPPDRRPRAVVSPGATAECTSAAGALVTLDGSLSEDPDSTPGTHDDIVRFEWFEGFGQPTQVLLGTGEVVTVALALGEHAITLRVTDRPGATHTATTTIEVVDTVSPTLSLAVAPSELWPPNHRMVPVEATVQATDLCGPTETVLVSVVSSEQDDAVGPEDGSTAGDIQGAEPGTPDMAFELRAERSGAGVGRVYVVTYRTSDVSGNVSEAEAAVTVPHEKEGRVEPLLLSVTDEPSGTVLTWDSLPEALSYTVIRGDIGSIRDHDEVFDLGNTTCIVAGTTALSTIGREDSQHPAAGAAFFYVAEYDDGRPSAYGSEGAAKPRAPAAGGGCP